MASKIVSYWWNGPSWEVLPFTVHPEFQLVCWPEFPTNFYIHYTCTYYRQNYIKYSLSFSLSHTLQDGPSRSALYLLASYLPKRSVSSISKGTLVALSSLRYPVKSHDYTSLLVALVAWKQAADVVKLTNQWLAPQLNWQVVIEGGKKCSNGLDENCMQNATHPKKKVCVGGVCVCVHVCMFNCVLLTMQGKRTKPSSPSPINGLHPDHTHQALLALDILNWMTVSTYRHTLASLSQLCNNYILITGSSQLPPGAKRTERVLGPCFTAQAINGTSIINIQSYD